MRLNSQVAPHYLPDLQQQTVLRLGLQALNPSTWMQRDQDYLQFLRHKQSVVQQFPTKVYGALPESEAAQVEFHQCLLAHLQDDHARVELPEKRFVSLWQSSLAVQEDICLLEQRGDRYILTAASVCSPSNWKLEEKIGRDLDMIHRPVPRYDHALSARVNRLFHKLKVDAPLLRYNWSLQDSNELFWRSDLSGPVDTTDPQWFWRVERQTLRRLPQTDGIVFTIRIYLHPIEQLCTNPKFLSSLTTMINGLPTDERSYKGLHRWLDKVKEHL